MAEKKKLSSIFTVAAAAALVGLSGCARTVDNDKAPTDPLANAQNSTLVQNQSSKFTFVPGKEFKETITENIDGGADVKSPSHEGIVSMGPGVYVSGQGLRIGVGPGIKIR